MFGERLKELRKEKKITQKVLANLLKLSPSTIGMYEQGRRDPDTDVLRTLSDYFDVSTDYLIGKSDIKSSNNTTNIRTTTDQILDVTGLPDTEIQKVQEYIELLKQKYNISKIKNKTKTEI